MVTAMTGGPKTKLGRKAQIVLWLAAMGSLCFAALQMWTYYRSQHAAPVVAPQSSALVVIDETHPYRTVLQAMIPINDPPPLVVPPKAIADGAWILNEVRNGRVDLQWVFNAPGPQDDVFAFFAKALTQTGFRRLGERSNRFGIPTEVWRKNENIISISLRNDTKKQRIEPHSSEPTLRLIIRQTREAKPADYQRTVPKQKAIGVPHG